MTSSTGFLLSGVIKTSCLLLILCPRRWLFGGHKSGVINAWQLASLSSCAWHLFTYFRPRLRRMIKVKVHTLDIAPLRSESPPQKPSGMARVLEGFHSFTCTPTRSSAIGMSHTFRCLPSYSWYSFTDPGGMEG